MDKVDNKDTQDAIGQSTNEKNIFCISIGSFDLKAEGMPAIVIGDLIKDNSPQLVDIIKQKNIKEWAEVLGPYAKDILELFRAYLKNKEKNQIWPCNKDFDTSTNSDGIEKTEHSNASPASATSK